MVNHPSETTPSRPPLDARHFEEHRPVLIAHCYRMLGSVTEAEDAVQETMLRAFRAAAGFEGRSSLRTWLCRIATRVCLDMLDGRTRRGLAMDFGPANAIDGPLTTWPHSRFVEPLPDAWITPPDADPAELFAMRQSIRLAFVAALQHLPPRQRAALLLAEVLGWPASEIAESLDASTAAVNSMLQRARATLRSRDIDLPLGPLPEPESLLLERYVDAFERYDVDALLSVVHEDAMMSMPPYPIWLRGHETIRYWFLGPGAECRGSRLLPTAACGAPAFGQYRRAKSGEGHEPWALIALQIRGSAIVEMTYFLDTETLFPRFGLPPRLP